MMKNNYLLTKEVLKELNAMYQYKPYEGFCLLASDNIDDDTIYIGFGDEMITKTTLEFLEEMENPFSYFIDDLYTINEKGQSKETAKSLERYLKKKFKEILMSDDDEEILQLVKQCKFAKGELDELDENLEWTKNIAKMLYFGKNLFEIALEEEYK